MIAPEQTLADLLEAAAQADRGSLTFIEGERDELTLNYGQLLRRAFGILWHFQQRGLQPGDAVILFTNSNEQFVDAFWACQLGGLVPVPVTVGISDDHRRKLLKIFSALERPCLYTEQALLSRMASFLTEAGQQALAQRLSEAALVVDELSDISQAGTRYVGTPDDRAFIQFSSGSTSDPKGVVLTHRNVLTNIRAIAEGYGQRQDDVALSWMPLTHDMGLIGFHLAMVAYQQQHHIMDTRLFVRRPLLWLEKAAEKRATLLCSPNFGYKHVLKLFESRGLEGVDLSAVRLIFNGAEPISASLCRQFHRAMAPLGLAANSMFPVYGLAEASLGVTFPEPGAALSSVEIQRHSLRVGASWVAAEPGAADAVEFVCLGRPIRDCELRIVDHEDQALSSGLVGHVQIRGGNVTAGYHGDQPPVASVFTADGWLRTGDLGFDHAGELVITGRDKDIIFVNGQNYYPHDIENVAVMLEELELGKVAAAGVSRAQEGTDELLLFVLYRDAPEAFPDLARRLRGLVNEQTGLEVAQVLPVARIPKTTSGKLQRHKLAEDYLNGAFADFLAEQAALVGASEHGSADAASLEETLRTICNSVVVDRAVGLDDNLFEIGISSLALAQIHARLEELYPGAVDIADVFDYPSIRELAAFMQSGPGAED